VDDTRNDYVIATYRLADGGDWTKKAETIALGMTIGSWPGLPAARQEALDRYAGRVVSERGDPVSVEISQKRYLALGLEKDAEVFVAPADQKIFVDALWCGDRFSAHDVCSSPLSTLIERGAGVSRILTQRAAV
jgi:hypothetical protein